MKILLYGFVFLAGALAVALTGSLWAFRRPPARQSPPPSPSEAAPYASAVSASECPIRRRLGSPTPARWNRRPCETAAAGSGAGRNGLDSRWSFFDGQRLRALHHARPIHPVELDGFWMDRTPVTNEQFKRFVRATGYITVAERKPDAKDFPGVPADRLFPADSL